MGRRGGQKTAQRLKTDPQGEYEQLQNEKLQKANRMRALKGDLLETKVKMSILDARAQQIPDPTTKELAAEFGVSVARIKQVRKTLGLQAKMGRPKKG